MSTTTTKAPAPPKKQQASKGGSKPAEKSATKKTVEVKKTIINPMNTLSKNGGWLDLDAIHGVNLDKGTYTPHAEFSNPKTELRQDVLSSLKLAKTPAELPAIEVWMHDDGKIVVTDGEHRVINAISQFMSGNRAFGRIRAEKCPVPNSQEAKIRQQIANIQGRRGNLTEAEEVGVVERLLMFGQTPEQIRTILGENEHTERWMNSVQRVLNANPLVKEAVTSGQISLGTADKIAQKVEPEDQPAAVDQAVEALTQGKSENEVRQEMGLRKGRPRFAKWAAIQQYVAGLFEGFKDGTLDSMQQGEMEAVLVFFDLSAKKKKEQVEALKAIYDDFMEKENKRR